MVVFVAIAAGAPRAHAALVASYQMNSPTQLSKSVGASTYEPNFVSPAAPAAPIYLPGAGVYNTGAIGFDGVDDKFNFDNSGSLYVGLTLGQAVSNQWTVSFWVKTTDAAAYPDNAHGGYDGTTEVPVLGNTNGAYGIGVNGGKASFRNAFTHVERQSSANVADGAGHYVAFVLKTDGTLDIYVNGLLDTAIATPQATSQMPFTNIGVGYGAGGNPYYGNGTGWSFDDLKIYDTALTASQVFALVPEPGSFAVTSLIAAGVTLRSRSRRRTVG
jgi:hypothetical protein